jgi:hypothetical protein
MSILEPKKEKTHPGKVLHIRPKNVPKTGALNLKFYNGSLEKFKV